MQQPFSASTAVNKLCKQPTETRSAGTFVSLDVSLEIRDMRGELELNAALSRVSDVSDVSEASTAPKRVV